jgi:DNA-binding transcriptional LysR family regulator
MSLEQFKMLVSVARHRNITKAAQELHTSQPVLSKQLKKLGESYHVKLLMRSGLGIQLSHEGIEFLEHVKSILQQLELLERRFLKPSDSNICTPLRVGAGYALSATVIPTLLGEFKKQFPDVDVALRSNATSTLEQMLAKGSIDIVVASYAPNNSELITEPFMPLNIIAVAAKGYPLPGQKKLTLHDLEKLPFIIRSGSNRKGITETFLASLRQQGFKPNILMRCDSPEAIKTAVIKKMGVGILYEGLVKDGIARGLFKRVPIADFPFKAQSYVVYPKHPPLSVSAETFLHILRRHCKTLQQDQVDVGKMVDATENMRVNNVSVVHKTFLLVSAATHSFSMCLL